jgi:sarcosine oxidase subunit alpha
MTARDAMITPGVASGFGPGVPARICRVSFSGELAYEINVAGWYGLAVWEAVMGAGEGLGITPYGTEAMHVLRAEKGYPIVGQDTDGTVTPQDLGMSWVVSRRKDFVGKRSHRRADTARGDRKHLVALLPADPDALLPEGAQLLAPDSAVPPADGPARNDTARNDTPGNDTAEHGLVPALGHVTSSHRSAALGRTFALGLVANGRGRIGETLYAAAGNRITAAVVADPLLYDKDGSRRDGVAGHQGEEFSANRAEIPSRSLPHSPLERVAGEMAVAGVAGERGVRIREVPFLAQVNVRVAPGGPAAARIAVALGTALPVRPGTVATAGRRRVLWLGPDEWLVTGPDGDAPEIRQMLRTALDGEPGSVLDVSADRTTIELSGPAARDVLEKGCSIDLHPRAFGPGRCAQTLVAAVGVILDQVDAAPGYRLLVRASFARYLADWLIDATREYRHPPVPR